MRTEAPADEARPTRAMRSGRLANQLDALGLAAQVPVHLRLHPRRVDVLLGGRPAALLMKPTTPLFARR
jgi:hypothetical protein